jgi:hypothetical protein
VSRRGTRLLLAWYFAVAAYSYGVNTVGPFATQATCDQLRLFVSQRAGVRGNDTAYWVSACWSDGKP